jgi:hypothetical protein
VTLNFQQDFEGYFNIKYNIEFTQIFNIQKEMDINFEFPELLDTIPKVLPRVDEKVIEEIEDDETEETENFEEEEEEKIESVKKEEPVKKNVPQLSKNLFGNFITGKTEDNIPIFTNRTTQKQSDQSNYSILQSPYINQAKNAAQQISCQTEDVDFTEKDDQDVHQLLSILRKQGTM